MIRGDTDVETVLQWAYRDELPKSTEYGGLNAGGSISPMFIYAELGGRIDEWMLEPGFPAAMGEPDPDALTVAACVEALPSKAIEWPGARAELVPDCAGLLEDDDYVLRAMLVDPIPWVVMAAKLGRRPDWQAEWSVRWEPHGANGRPRVLDRRKIGARCPVVVTPDPRGVAADRAIFVAWHEALGEVRDMLNDSVKVGRLEGVRVTGPACSGRPWVAPDRVVHIYRSLKGDKALGRRSMLQAAPLRGRRA